MTSISWLVGISDENEQSLRKSLTDFGFGDSLPERSMPLLVLGKILMLGRPPLRIDILTKIDGVSYEEVESTCLYIELDGLRIPVISPEMLCKNKEATGRNNRA